MSHPTPPQVRALYRQLLRAGSRFHDYNVRGYVGRRVRELFRRHRGEGDGRRIRELVQKAESSLAVAQRQATISEMFAEKEQFVMDQWKANNQSSRT